MTGVQTCALPIYTTAGIKARHIPYKGSAPAMTDVINGQVNYTIETLASVIGHIRSGRVRALGVSTAKRAGAMPELPTLQEAAGLADFDVAAWIGYAAPAGTPQEVVTRLSGEILKAMQAPDFREKMLNAGLEPSSLALEELPAFVKREQERYAAVIKSANIKVE